MLGAIGDEPAVLAALLVLAALVGPIIAVADTVALRLEADRER